MPPPPPAEAYFLSNGDPNKAKITFNEPLAGENLRATITLEQPATTYMRFGVAIDDCSMSDQYDVIYEGLVTNGCTGTNHAQVDGNTGSDFERHVYYNSVEDRDANGNSRVDGKWGADGNNPIYWLYHSRYIEIPQGSTSGSAEWETVRDSDNTRESLLVKVVPFGGAKYAHDWIHADTPRAASLGGQNFWETHIKPDFQVDINWITPAAITEGDAITTQFGITPTPTTSITINFQITQMGGNYYTSDFNSMRTATVSASHFVNVGLHTDNDNVVEGHGSITYTLLPGPDYRIVEPISATVQVTDDDTPGGSPTQPPIVSLTATGNGAEGDDVTFGIESKPPPLAPFDVSVTLSHTGGLLADSDAGKHIITIPTSGFASLTVPTINDQIADKNTITITINDGDGYTVGIPSSDTITIPDSGVPDMLVCDFCVNEKQVQESTPPQKQDSQDGFTPDSTLISNIHTYAAETWRGQEHVDRWHRVLKTLGAEKFPSLTTMTSAEAYTYVQQGWNRWIPVVAELKAFEAWQPQTPQEQPQTPQEQPQTPQEQPQTPQEQPQTPQEQPQTPQEEQQPVPPQVPPDEPLTLSVSDAHAVEGDSLAFELALNKPSADAINVYYITIDWTATTSDYEFSTDMVTFSPGQTLMTVLVPTIADGVAEDPEKMLFEITIADGARIGNYTGTGIISDRSAN